MFRYESVDIPKMTGFLLIAVLIILIPVSADIRRDCRRETHVSWDSLKKLRAGDVAQEDPKLKCYLKCFMMKSGIMNKNAEVDVQRALRHIPRSLQDSSKNLLNRCKYVTAEDPCEKAFEIVKCSVQICPDILKSGPII